MFELHNHLCDAVKTIDTFTDGEECVDFLGDIEDEKVCMVISGSLGQQIVPLVHNMPQVDSILIFCSNHKYHKEWVRNWSKIKGLFTQIESICGVFKQAARQCEENAIPISIINSVGDDDMKDGDRLDPCFMYTQIIKETLLTIDFERKHIDAFIQYCRELFSNNNKQLENIDKFGRK